MSTTHSTTHETTAVGTARSRPTVDQEAKLRNLAASFAMENMEPSADELEVLAAYTLGEISSDQCDQRLDALP